MNIKALQEAIRTIWLLPASGLPADRVYFARQEMETAAPSPRLVVDLGDIDSFGQLDEVKYEVVAGAPAGQEIKMTARGPRELTVTMEAFSPSADAKQAENDARQLLSRVMTWLGLPTVRPALNAAGLGILRRGLVRWIPGIPRAAWEGRASVETIFCVVETAEARVGYIQTVQGTRTIDQVSTPYTLTLPES